LGSKISLISKSEIRYEGILYTIDAEQSIIALAKVRSFGTEGRPSEMPVGPRDEVYEYIIFRGTDIKKIEVCENTSQQTLSGLHNDPAIVQHSAPSVPSSFQAAPFSRQSLGPIGGGLGGLSYGGFGQGQQGLPGASGGFQIGGAAPAQPSVLSDILVGSRSSTPSNAHRKSPVSDAGVQVSPPPTQQEKKKSPQHKPQEQRSGRGGQQRRQQQQQGSPQQPQQHQQAQPQQQHQRQQHDQGYQNQGYNQGYNHGYNQGYQQNYRGGMGRGRPMRRGGPGGPRGGRGGFNQGLRQRQQQDQELFKNDYDFEQANEEFEELKNQLAKTKISDTVSSVENGEAKKDDSGHETAGGEDVEDAQPDPIFYDKAKSFFDSISCEAIERSKGKSQRPDWRLERKTNVETFGVSSARRGYFPRGGRGYYRGGQGGYYRNYNNYNNYNNQGYYNNRGGGGGYRGGRGGGGGGRGGGGGPKPIIPQQQRGDSSSSSGSNGVPQQPPVRNSTPTKAVTASS